MAWTIFRNHLKNKNIQKKRNSLKNRLQQFQPNYDIQNKQNAKRKVNFIFRRKRKILKFIYIFFWSVGLDKGRHLNVNIINNRKNMAICANSHKMIFEGVRSREFLVHFSTNYDGWDTSILLLNLRGGHIKFLINNIFLSQTQKTLKTNDKKNHF